MATASRERHRFHVRGKSDGIARAWDLLGIFDGLGATDALWMAAVLFLPDRHSSNAGQAKGPAVAEPFELLPEHCWMPPGLAV
ncbi:MAG: hypothetical protein ACJ768_21105 [Gaiellaceae bacterium]